MHIYLDKLPICYLETQVTLFGHIETLLLLQKYCYKCNFLRIILLLFFTLLIHLSFEISIAYERKYKLQQNFNLVYKWAVKILKTFQKYSDFSEWKWREWKLSFCLKHSKQQISDVINAMSIKKHKNSGFPNEPRIFIQQKDRYIFQIIMTINMNQI